MFVVCCMMYAVFECCVFIVVCCSLCVELFVCWVLIVCCCVLLVVRYSFLAACCLVFGDMSCFFGVG